MQEKSDVEAAAATPASAEAWATAVVISEALHSTHTPISQSSRSSLTQPFCVIKQPSFVFFMQEKSDVEAAAATPALAEARETVVALTEQAGKVQQQCGLDILPAEYARNVLKWGLTEVTSRKWQHFGCMSCGWQGAAAMQNQGNSTLRNPATTSKGISRSKPAANGIAITSNLACHLSGCSQRNS